MYAKRITLMLIAVLLTLCSTMKAQTDPTYRCEIGAGLGMSNYIGDFNSSMLKNFQPSASIIFRRIISPYTALRADLSYNTMKGSNADEESYYPELVGVQYDFKRTMIELNTMFEYNFFPYGTGQDYRGAKRVTPFIFIGLGANSTSGSDRPSSLTLNVPIGLGAKIKVKERLNVGIEWGMHFTLTDMLDGYKDLHGVEASGLFKSTDCYSKFLVTLTYSFSAKCPTCNKDDW